MGDFVMRGPDGKRRKVFLAINEPDELAKTLENLGAEVVVVDPNLSVSELKKIYDNG